MPSRRPHPYPYPSPRGGGALGGNAGEAYSAACALWAVAAERSGVAFQK
jgi:hypothetical protein